MQAQGVNFLNASLQGADLTGAQLQLADFSSAALQGAVLNFARLEGAVLRDADLEAASLQQAKLIAADMTGMKMAGSDLRGAVIWLTPPPVWDTTGLSDLTELAVRAPDEAERASVQKAMERITDEALRRRGDEVVGALAEKDKTWSGTIDQQRWQSWVGASPVPPALNFKVDLTTYLTKLMCSARWSNGAIATGIARRAVSAQFRGDVVAVYDNLRAGSCPASKEAPPKVDEGPLHRRRDRPLDSHQRANRIPDCHAGSHAVALIKAARCRSARRPVLPRSWRHPIYRTYDEHGAGDSRGQPAIAASTAPSMG